MRPLTRASVGYSWSGRDPCCAPGELREVLATTERAIGHVDELDEKVGGQPDEAFVGVGVFGGCGRDAYLAESRAVLEAKVVKRLPSFR